MNVLLLLLGFLLASAPFLLPVKTVFKLIVFILTYVLFIVIGRLFEASVGQNAPQGWAFYAVTFLLFVVAAFPAFTWRYLWHKKSNA